MIILVAVVAGAAAFLLILLVIPAAIFAWPFFTLAPVALVLGPTDDPPVRRTIAMITGRWGAIALRILLLNLTLFAINAASTAIIVTPLLGLIVSLVLQVGYYLLQMASLVLIYEYADGPLAPDLTAPTQASASTFS